MGDINKWKRKMRKMLDENAVGGDYDTDHPECPECGGTMTFNGGDDRPVGDGFWECDSCGFSITEDEVY